jgi:hypothetical protein
MGIIVYPPFRARSATAAVVYLGISSVKQLAKAVQCNRCIGLALGLVSLRGLIAATAFSGGPLPMLRARTAQFPALRSGYISALRPQAVRPASRSRRSMA